jgi:hypothetical protein
MNNKTQTAKRRLQFVWWGFRFGKAFDFKFHRWKGAMSRIYRWSLILWPLEIRRWR